MFALWRQGKEHSDAVSVVSFLVIFFRSAVCTIIDNSHEVYIPNIRKGMQQVKTYYRILLGNQTDIDINLISWNNFISIKKYIYFILLLI